MLNTLEEAACIKEAIWDVYPLSSGQEENSERAEVSKQGCALRAPACPGELGIGMEPPLNGQRKYTVDGNGDFNLR